MFDYIVVGSGAGGAAVARELACSGKKVLILEAGPEAKASEANRAYSIIPSAVEIWSTLCFGGTTMVTMGNAVRSDTYSDLSKYYDIAEKDLGVSKVPDTHIGPATKALLDCSGDWQRMPKAIDFSKCKMCGRCAVGCPHGARWDASRYLAEAARNGAEILTSTEVKKILIGNNSASGVESFNGQRFEGNAVILCAGGIETPRILARSGVDGAGKGLFVDTFMTVGGVKRGAGSTTELGMALVIKREGYLLSPHYSSFVMPYLTSKGIASKPSDILSMMVKIEDEPAGIVSQEGVEKPITQKDSKLLEQGRVEAIEILTAAGVEKGSIVSTYYRGTHPGGTCSKVVNSSYATDVDGLYISDASVIPGPFGIPPMLTIIAIAKKLSASILGRD